MKPAVLAATALAVALAAAVPVQAVGLGEVAEAKADARAAVGGAAEATGTSVDAGSAETRTAVVGNAALDGGIKGQPVYGPNGRKIGHIANVVTTEDGTVHQVIVEYGGFFGFGSKGVAVDASKVRKNGDQVLMEYTEAELKAIGSAQVN